MTLPLATHLLIDYRTAKGGLWDLGVPNHSDDQAIKLSYGREPANLPSNPVD